MSMKWKWYLADGAAITAVVQAARQNRAAHRHQLQHAHHHHLAHQRLVAAVAAVEHQHQHHFN